MGKTLVLRPAIGQPRAHARGRTSSDARPHAGQVHRGRVATPSQVAVATWRRWVQPVDPGVRAGQPRFAYVYAPKMSDHLQDVLVRCDLSTRLPGSRLVGMGPRLA
jgi:hypothetical protein